MEIDTDIADYKTILAYKGAIKGYVGECVLEHLYEAINENCKKYLKNAQGILVKFECSLEFSNNTPFADVMKKMDAFLVDDQDIIYTINENNKLKGSTVSYQIICTGL